MSINNTCCNILHLQLAARSTASTRRHFEPSLDYAMNNVRIQFSVVVEVCVQFYLRKLVNVRVRTNVHT